MPKYGGRLALVPLEPSVLLATVIPVVAVEVFAVVDPDSVGTEEPGAALVVESVV
jgi:hypothetical protein